MLISGLDTYVNALGRVATGRGTIVFVELTKEIREGFDLATLGFPVTNFLRLAFGIVVLNAEDGSVLGVADFKFHLQRSAWANPCCHAGFSRPEPLDLRVCKIANNYLPKDFANRGLFRPVRDRVLESEVIPPLGVISEFFQFCNSVKKIGFGRVPHFSRSTSST
jgi:hypothetical protein